MQRCAIVSGGKVTTVTNIRDGDSETQSALGAIPCSDAVSIGWLYDGSAFTAPAPVVEVPFAVTRRQAMAVLIKYGLDVQIEGALQGQIDAATNAGDAAALLSAKLAMNDYRESQQFERKWPLIAAMQSVFGWSNAYVDALFVEAAAL